MEIEVFIKKKVNAKTLKVNAGVRYWEDATINGVEDTIGALVPFKNGKSWQPIIDIDSGTVIDWPKGTKAEIHYKVCDAGCYYLLDESGEVVACIEEDYVPNILCPEGLGYGDYIIMNIDGEGKIANWKIDLSDFLGGNE